MYYILVNKKNKVIAEGNNLVALERLSVDIHDRIFECTSEGSVDVTDYNDEDTESIHLSRIERGVE